MNQKRTPVTLSPSGNLVRFKVVGILQTRGIYARKGTQTVQNSRSAFSAVLGKCQWY